LHNEQLHRISFLNPSSGTLTWISTPPQWQVSFFIYF